MPDFHKLQVFLTVAEEGSFSAAAKKLHLTQSAISFQISALEEYYQAPLFERLSRGVALTETGEILKKYAREIIALSQRLDEDIAELKGLVRGRLTIGASTIPGEYILPRYIGIFTANFPKVEVNMKVADSKKVVDMVLAREIDLGMVGTLFDERKLVSRPVLSDRLLLIASPEHPLAKREKVELKDILDYPFVLRERGSGTRRVMERGLEEAGISPGQIKLRMELGSTEAVKTAVEEGLGLSFVSEWAVKKEVRLGTLKVVDVEGLLLKRDLYLVAQRQRLQSFAASKFWELVAGSKEPVIS